MDAPFRPIKPPRSRLEFGRDAVCPKCKGRGRLWRWGMRAPVLCDVCKGKRIVR